MNTLSKLLASALLSVSLVACAAQTAIQSAPGHPKFTTGISAPEPVRR